MLEYARLLVRYTICGYCNKEYTGYLRLGGVSAAKLVAEYLVNELIGSGWTFSRRRPPTGHSTHPPKGG
jgi:hypothetical protein